MRGRLIAFSGLDGSGKSTQLETLREHFVSEGRSVHVLWYRPGYSGALNQLRRMIRRRVPGLPARGDLEARRRVLGRPFVSECWVSVALLDTLWTFGVHLRWMLRKYDVVICDRYIVDAALDISSAFPDTVVGRGLSGLRHVCPSPDLHVLLTVSLSVAQRRCAEKDEPFPDDEPTRRFRLAGYMRAEAAGGLVVVDTDAQRGEVHQRIVRLVQRVWAP